MVQKEPSTLIKLISATKTLLKRKSFSVSTCKKMLTKPAVVCHYFFSKIAKKMKKKKRQTTKSAALSNFAYDIRCF